MAHAGLVTAHAERVHAGGRASEVTRVRITEACAARIASVAPLAEAASNLSVRRGSALLVRLSLGGINPRVLPNHQGKGIIT
jgi:hypothetical protein